MQELHLVVSSLIFIISYTVPILSHLNNLGSKFLIHPDRKHQSTKEHTQGGGLIQIPCRHLVQYLTSKERWCGPVAPYRRSCDITSTPLLEVWPPLGLLPYPETCRDLAVGKAGWREQCKKTTNDNPPHTQASPQLPRNDFSVGLANNDPREAIASLKPKSVTTPLAMHPVLV